MCKFVRWMGAYHKKSDLYTSVDWELNQQNRVVAVEPLFFGRSILLSKNTASIGLVVDENRSHFVAGWLDDCYSTGQDLRVQSKTEENTVGALFNLRYGRGESNMNKFLRSFVKNKRWVAVSGECHFDSVTYCAVAYRAGCSRSKKLAIELAEKLNLSAIAIATHKIK